MGELRNISLLELVIMRYFGQYESPLGLITIQCDEQGITGIWFETHATRPEDLGAQEQDLPLLQQAKSQLEQYFARQRHEFTVPLSLYGTVFQCQVWRALMSIPFGETRSYQDLAEQIGNPKAVRAVGSANGRNPISVLVPCHRVVGKNGQLSGYAGGVERKQALLELEGVLPLSK